MRSRYFMPLFTLFLGALVFTAFAIGGDLTNGLLAIPLFVGIAAVFFFARRNETIQGLGGPGRDERWAMIDLTATAATGAVLIAVVIGCWLVEIAKGHDGSPYGQLGAIAGVAYILSVAIVPSGNPSARRRARSRRIRG
jgi:hypothetical protein